MKKGEGFLPCIPTPLEMEDRPLYYNIKTDHILFPFFFFFFFHLSFSNGEFSTLITVEALFFFLITKKSSKKTTMKENQILFPFLFHLLAQQNITTVQTQADIFKHTQGSISANSACEMQRLLAPVHQNVCLPTRLTRSRSNSIVSCSRSFCGTCGWT